MADRQWLAAVAMVAVVAGATVSVPVCAADKQEPADTIFSGGHIVTVNDTQPAAEAVAVRDGVIVAVGQEGEVLAWKGPKTELVDLGTQTLMPGLIEPHTHPLASALLSQAVDVSGFSHDSRDSMMAALAEAVEKAGKGEWIIAFGWDPAMKLGLRAPSLAEMDRLAPDNPLLIMTQTMHTVFVNSPAYQSAGVTRDTPSPGGTGSFDKDEHGNLNGTVRESPAISRFRAQFGPVPRAAYAYLLAEQYNAYARNGYTTIGAAGPPPVVDDHLGLLRETALHPTAPLRTFVYVLTGIMSSPVAAAGSDTGNYRVLGVKLHVDGSPYAGGMAMRRPYLETELTTTGLGIPAGSRGHLNFSDAELFSMVSEHHSAGRQVAAHVQGERAMDQYLDAIEAALDAHPRRDHRHRLEHNALITDAQLERAARLGVTPSFYIDHVHLYGRALKDSIVGPQRAARFMPLGWARKHGHRFSIHTDTPASPFGPFRALRGAVTRKMRTQAGGQGEVLGPDQRVSIEDAIKAMTINAAWQLFAEDRIGSIEVGKLADFVVLSENPLLIDPDRLTEIEIMETYLGGRRVKTEGWSKRKIVLMAKALWALAVQKISVWR